jgi:hypothetical protein
MKRFLGGIALVALILGLSVESAAAQMRGMVKYPAIGGTGVKIFGDFAKGINDESFKDTYFGGRVELGIPVAQFWAGAGSVKGDSATFNAAQSSNFTWGGGAAFNLIGGISPIKLGIQAGFGSVSEEGSTFSQIPFGVSVHADLGTGGVGVKPFGYVYGNYTMVSVDIQDVDNINEFAYGLTGGLEVNLPMGLGFQAAVGVESVKNETPLFSDKTRLLGITANIGAAYKIQVPSLGM